MTIDIDILTYELKYKNDPMVMELLKAYQSSVDEAIQSGEIASEQESRADELQDFMHNWAEDIESAIGDILDGSESEKKQAVEVLEKLAKRMRL